MDQRVKERLIGASILVAIAVLVVPELLSGPKTTGGPAPLSLPGGAPEPTRTVTVDLATSQTSPSSTASTPTPPASTASERAAAQAPASGAEAATGSAAAPGPSAAAPTPSVAARPSPSAAGSATPLEMATPSPRSSSATSAVASSASPTLSATPAASRAWAVQLGSFASFANSEKLLAQLKAQGYSAYVSSSGEGTSMRYRVRVGPLSDRGAAAQTVAKLKDAGHTATIVPPAP